MRYIGIIIAILFMLITLWAQRGEHSRIHHTLAGTALGLEVQMGIAAIMDMSQPYIALGLTLFICVLLVFLTDGRDGRAWYRRMWDWFEL